MSITEEVPVDELDTTAEKDLTDDEWEGEPPANGKRTLEELAAEQPDAEIGEESDGQLFIPGTEAKISNTVKGARATVSKAKLKSGGVAVTGQFNGDDVVELRVLARLDKVEFSYTRDKDGRIKGVARMHHLTPLSIEPVEPVEPGD
jgi:hypothetical protein